MTQQRKPDFPNEEAAEHNGGLYPDVQRARMEAERKEIEAIAEGVIQTAEFWSGRKSGFDFVLTVLGDSVWKPVHADVYPNEEYVLSVEVLINRKTGNANTLFGGKWDDNEELESAFDLIHEAAHEIVSLNPAGYATDPAPRTARLRQASIPALDTFSEPLMLSAADVAGTKFIYDDGQFAFLTLPDGQTVRVELVDAEVEPVEN